MFKRLHGNTSCVPVLSLSVTARRGYRTMPNFTTDHEVASATQILGLDPDLAVSDKEVKAAFLRELRKLSRKPQDNPTGLAHQKPSIANYHSATLTDCVPNVKIHSSEDDRSRRIKKLVAAYKFMLKGGNGARVRYAQFDAVTPDGLLGEIKLESPFSNHDSRHQEFAFSDPSALPLTERRIDATPGGKWRKSAAGVRPGDPSVPGTTVDFRLSLTFQEALVGCTKTLRLTRDVSCKACEGSGDAKSASRKCSSCKGRGRFEVPSGTYLIKKDCVTCGASGKIPAPLCKPCAGTGMTLSEVTLSVTIPPGAKTGTVIKLRGEGNAGLRGGKAGDLAVTVLVAAHRVLHRVQDDLHVALPVPLSTALLGGKIEVPKADGGTIQVAVPPGVSSGYTISVPGLGAPRAGTKDHFGDLRVHLIVLIPDVEKLTKTQRHAMHLFQTTEEPIPLSVDVLAEAKAQFRHWLPMANAGD